MAQVQMLATAAPTNGVTNTANDQPELGANGLPLDSAYTLTDPTSAPYVLPPVSLLHPAVLPPPLYPAPPTHSGGSYGSSGPALISLYWPGPGGAGPPFPPPVLYPPFCIGDWDDEHIDWDSCYFDWCGCWPPCIDELRPPVCVVAWGDHDAGWGSVFFGWSGCWPPVWDGPAALATWGDVWTHWGAERLGWGGLIPVIPDFAMVNARIASLEAQVAHLTAVIEATGIKV